MVHHAANTRLNLTTKIIALSRTAARTQVTVFSGTVVTKPPCKQSSTGTSIVHQRLYTGLVTGISRGMLYTHNRAKTRALIFDFDAVYVEAVD